MSTSELRTTIWGETVAVRADWSQAGSLVYRLAPAKADTWENTGRQVADYRHDAHAALREELDGLAEGPDGGGRDCSMDIDIAMEDAEEQDDSEGGDE